MIEIMKQAALEAVEASDPMKAYYGTVSSVNPLSVMIDQKYTIPSEFLILARNVTDYDIEISAELETEDNKDEPDAKAEQKESEKVAKHKHEIKAIKKKIKIHNALNVGDKVILLRIQGGQDYVVLDKVGG